jgi:hypothetical protein
MPRPSRLGYLVLAAMGVSILAIGSCVSRTKLVSNSCSEFVRHQMEDMQSFGRVELVEALGGGGTIVAFSNATGIRGFAFLPEHVWRHNFSLNPNLKITRAGQCWSDGLEYKTVIFAGSNNDGI